MSKMTLAESGNLGKNAGNVAGGRAQPLITMPRFRYPATLGPVPRLWGRKAMSLRWGLQWATPTGSNRLMSLGGTEAERGRRASPKAALRNTT